MPRSKRRKGVPKGQTVRELKIGGTISANRIRPKAYYDPGAKPRPQNMVKALAPRHDHRRGS